MIIETSPKPAKVTPKHRHLAAQYRHPGYAPDSYLAQWVLTGDPSVLVSSREEMPPLAQFIATRDADIRRRALEEAIAIADEEAKATRDAMNTRWVSADGVADKLRALLTKDADDAR